MPKRHKIPASFYRGGTSKAVVFKDSDLPTDQEMRDQIFLHVLGSPDPYKRQLDGLGGGLSSLSKVVVIAPSQRPDADIDYTFVQIAVDAPVADYGSMCGNMLSMVGPFAIEEGFLDVPDGPTSVRVFNTNTNKLFVAHFTVKDGLPVEQGDFEIPGVAQTGAEVRLEALDPGGSKTGALLPTGLACQTLDVPGVGAVRVSLIDAANPVVYVRAEDVGMTATEQPSLLDSDADFMTTMDAIRRAGGVAMGLADTPQAVPLSNPKVAMIAPPQEYQSIDGAPHSGTDYNIAVRLISMGNVHRAITLTGAMCVAVGAAVPGSVLQDVSSTSTGPVLIGTPSGKVPVRADVSIQDGVCQALSATTYRTQRRLMVGAVMVPSSIYDRSIQGVLSP